MPMSSRGAALCALLLLLGAADVGAFRVGALPLAPRSRFWAPRARATAPRASAVDPKDLPKPVPGFFPLWESNVLQTFGHLFSKSQLVALERPMYWGFDLREFLPGSSTPTTPKSPTCPSSRRRLQTAPRTTCSSC